jgi:hypothetical protein
MSSQSSVAKKQAVKNIGEKQEPESEIEFFQPRIFLFAERKPEKIDPVFFAWKPFHGAGPVESR